MMVAHLLVAFKLAEFESSDSAAMCVAAKPEPTFAVSWVLFDALLPFIHGGGMVKDEADPCYL